MPPLALDKRWRDRAPRWIAPGETFAPASYAVDVVPDRVARGFVEAHHYAGSYVAARLAVGLFGVRGQLVGVAVFSVPMNQRVITAHTGCSPDAGCELGRFVCDPSVAYNGESWFLARAFRLLRQEKPQIRAVVSYADPLERAGAGGIIVKPQHWGTIYQASNAFYAGPATPRTLLLLPNGQVLSGRALSKVRSEERGCEYAARQITEAGAPPRWPDEAPRAWLTRVRASAAVRRVRHPGNLTYVFGLEASVRDALRERFSGNAYPRAERAA